MTSDAIDRKEQILQEIGELVEMMYEEKEKFCVSCGAAINEKYLAEIEPLRKEYEELEFGDRVISASD